MATKVIDVSKYQGVIDWAKVKADGVAGAIIRCGYANRDGSITADPYFKRNMLAAAAAGMPVGVYVYSYCRDETGARTAARNVLEMVKPYKLEYPLVWDCEESKIAITLGKAKNTAICKAALEVWEQAGYYAMLYSYKNFVGSYLYMNQLAAYDFWLAHYTAKTNYSGPYGMWQYSSSGSVNGINGRVDMNHCYRDYPAIIRGAGLNGFGTPELTSFRVGPLSAGDAAKLLALAGEMGVACTEV